MLPISRITAISLAPCIWVFILGTAIARITRMMEITIRSSISVKPRRRWRVVLIPDILDARRVKSVQGIVRTPRGSVNSNGCPVLGLLAGDQLVEDRQDLLAIKVGSLELLPHRL